jgi:hypothetical protein
MTQTQAFAKTTIKTGLARAIALGAVALMVAAAILAFVNSAPTRISPIDAAPLAPTIDPCNPNRPAEVWFPPQVEAEFAERCDR